MLSEIYSKDYSKGILMVVLYFKNQTWLKKTLNTFDPAIDRYFAKYYIYNHQ